MRFCKPFFEIILSVFILFLILNRIFIILILLFFPLQRFCMIRQFLPYGQRKKILH
ncbi:Hypothetical protein NGK_0271 [Neisseria gonorrhoeae NCCP11945]|uniref:Uncharacterized protein n=1 Tax=Neisseria gonorrhoeae (strain NCCP11945) TaxID=521006 RepID=B4RJ10_NEIG2|nr:Hypothetical protein NGK_0271 [Neisseria gonorrhoeae NCCP11945]